MTKDEVGNDKGGGRVGNENKGRRTVIQSQRQQKVRERRKPKKEDHKGPRFDMLKLLILSSKSSVARVWHDFWETFGEVVIDVVVAALFNFDCDVSSSRSTTFTTALPSNTFRTLSASTPFRGDCPEKASQNADPSLANKVCEASEASTASWGVALSEGSVVRADVGYLGVLLGTTGEVDGLVVAAAK